MSNEKVFQMKFSKVYPLLIAKAERKSRTLEEVETIVCWLTGYSREALKDLAESDTSYGDFFRLAPELNPTRKQITGTVCGVRVETIDDTLMQEIRYLDKLIDELAKGKSLDKILRKKV